MTTLINAVNYGAFKQSADDRAKQKARPKPPSRFAEREIPRLSLAPRLIEGVASGPYAFLMRMAADWYGLLMTP
jgi:hypothetical protein